MSMSGVQTPAAKNPVYGKPMELIVVGELRNVQVRWFDKQGEGHDEIFLVGPDGTVYRDPDAEARAGKLQVVNEQLSKQVNEQLKRAKLSTPDQDVDV